MISLVLDQSSTNTGWALVIDGEVSKEHHGRIKPKGNKDILCRLRFLRVELERLLFNLDSTVGRVNEIVLENNLTAGKKSWQAAYGISSAIYVCQDFAWERDIPFFMQNQSTIKSRFTGNGNSKKQTIMELVEEIYGIKPLCDNHADAIAGATVWVELGQYIRAGIEPPKVMKKRKTA